jgi:hypothetical protein
MEHHIVQLAQQNANQFPDDFLAWLPANLHVWGSFVREAHAIHRRGIRHYSARTIVHFLRHHTSVHEVGEGWKINNNHSPYLARLFDLRYPEMRGLFSHRETPKAKREAQLWSDMTAQRQPA